jgi:GNAT superfamily N-acetyltransferase
VRIRRADVHDTEALVAMALHFQTTTKYAAHLRATAETFRALLGNIFSSDEAAIWIAERDGLVLGMIAAMLYTQPMSGERIGSELCWWMEPEARGGRTALRLLRTAETWAKAQGAVVFQMMAPNADVGRLYEALHYEPIETHYMRRIA